MNDEVTSLLVIGGHDTGKTHYGGQLLGRLREGESHLRLRAAIENITPFEEALNSLGQGVPASHTPITAYMESLFPIQSASGKRMDLVWPDYAGEQITKTIMGQRQVTHDWRQRVQESDGWLLFIRLEQIRDYKDILSRPIAEMIASARQSPKEEAKWSDQAVYVELLQILLFVKGVGLLTQVRNPALTILLSCWDEMGYVANDTAPVEVLRSRMPLLVQFLESNWDPKYFNVFGLSSLEKNLRADAPDEGYLEHGPEKFGYVILPDGVQSSDLTLPVSTLMELVS